MKIPNQFIFCTILTCAIATQAQPSEPLPLVHIAATVPETLEPSPDTRVAPGEFTIKREGNTNDTLVLFLEFTGTAAFGQDYQEVSRLLTLPAGERQLKVLVGALDDLVVEGNETVIATLTLPPFDSAINYRIDPQRNRATVVIHDNDPPPLRPVIRLELDDPSAAETLIFQNNIDWAEFRVLRTGDLSRELDVFLNTQQGSARLGEDYRLDGVLNGSSVRIPAGTNSVNVRLYPIDDDFYEADETVLFHLIEPQSGTPLADQYGVDLAHSSVAMVIHDNDPVTTRLEITAPRNGQHFEAGSVIELRAQIIGPGSSNGLWSVEFLDGDRPIGTTRPGGTIWWDNAIGGEHIINARAVTPATGVMLAATPVMVFVGSGPSWPVVSIDATGWRTAEPCPVCLVAPGVFTVSRTGLTNEALTVYLQYDGTATPGLDYLELPRQIVIPAGKKSAEFLVLPTDDALAEGPEIVRATIALPEFATRGYIASALAGEAMVVISDDEAGAPELRLDIVDPEDGAQFALGTSIQISALAVWTQSEVDRPVEFYSGNLLIGRSDPPDLGRPSIPGLPSLHSIFWTNPPSGQHVLTARFAISAGLVVTSPPVKITIGPATLPVVRLETLPLQNAQALEFCPPNADCAYPSFVVRRSGPTNEELRVYLSYSGTATAGIDYPLLPESLVIPAGRDTAFLMLVPKDDALVEGPETVIARFTPVPGPSYVPHPDHLSATITIIDNERPLDTVVSIGVEDPIASEISMLTVVDPARFRISRTGDVSRDLLVFFSLHGSATPGQDYQELNASVRIPAGQSAVTFDVIPKFDQLAEGMETVFVRLEPSALAGPLPTYNIAPASRDAVAIILDNGSAPTPGLEIVAPEDGDRFSSPTSIEIIAAAFHPTQDILGVDFYAGAAKIGESIVIFDKPDSGGLIVHRFTWNNPPNGVHLLTARGFNANQVPVLTSLPVRITVGSDLPRPVVRIEATQRIAEESSEPFRRLNLVGEFTVSRIGPTNNSLSVFVKCSGMATPGADYPSLPRLVTIPPGSVSTIIRVEAINDHLPEGIETLVATLSNCAPGGIDPATGITCFDGFDIDAAHSEATVFIRDDGVTTASLAIIRPQDGTAFSAGDAIHIEAVAIDLDGYISRVEFWDGELKIGVSEIVFIRAPDPGTPIQHSFEWRGAASGPHTVTARATRADGNVLQSQPVHITVGRDPFPAIVRIDVTSRIAEENSDPFAPPALRGLFTISRTGPTNESMSVFVHYSGTATAGTDYQETPWIATIAAGARSTQIAVVPRDDGIAEGIETVVAKISNCPPPGILMPCGGFNVDPAHGSATVFIRDFGNIEASLTVTSPKDGATYEFGDTIQVEATAIDVNGYINRVEFWDGEQRIGVSEIQFIVPPDPGTPIQHRFEWRAAAAGSHLLTARVPLANGTVIRSRPVDFAVRNELPTDRELHIISLYSGVTASGGPSRNNERGEASVVVNRPGKKVTLVLSSYEPVLWHVTSGNATLIEKVILGGYYRQDIDGIAAGVDIVNAYYDEGRGTSNYLWPGTSLDSGRFFRVLQKLCQLVGLDVASFQGTYTAPYPAPLVVDQVQNDPRLRCDYPQPVDLSQLPNINFRLAFNDGGSGSVAFQDYTLQGAANASRLFPAWRVVTDAVGRYFYGADFHESWRVDTQTSTVQKLLIPSSLPEFSWPVGIAFDSQRNRILVATLVGEGYLYAYSPASGQWSLVRGLENEDLDSLVYHPANDSLYGVTAAYYDGGAPSLLRLNANGEVTGEIPLPVQPYGVGTGGFRSELASVGEYLVLLLETGDWLADNGRPEARIYLIDPRDGRVWLTYRKVEIPPNRPPVITIVTPADGARFDAGATIELGARVTDPDGNLGAVTKVEFFANGRKIGEAPGPTTAPISWLFAWTNVTTGDYALTARASDILGATTTSSPVHITVGDAKPLVRIVATQRIAEETSAPLRRMNLIGEFTISRTGPTTWSLPIFVQFSGTAMPGADYRQPPGMVIIPEGAASTTIQILAVDDGVAEGIETVVARLVNCPPCPDPANVPCTTPCVDFAIDSAHENATIFVRDDGITEASLTITRPRDGAVFGSETAILIEALGIDLNGYISWVEFWDGERKIGDSIIDFFRAPDPGTPINHSFAWRGASAGAHVLTARAVRADGTVLKSSAVEIRVTTSDFLPTVDVVVRDAFAVEPRTNTDLDAAMFGIRRIGPTNANLVVNYTLQGSAQNGVDYATLSGEAVIPAGQRFVNVMIRPLPDTLAEQDESVILRLEDSPGEQPPRYYVGLQRRAVAIISDNASAPTSPEPQSLSLANGMPHICFAAESGRTYRIEASSDLRQWESVGVATASGGALHFVDPEAMNIKCRFYRLAPEPITATGE